MHRYDQRGMTLIELVAVIAILVIIAAAAYAFLRGGGSYKVDISSFASNAKTLVALASQDGVLPPTIDTSYTPQNADPASWQNVLNTLQNKRFRKMQGSTDGSTWTDEPAFWDAVQNGWNVSSDRTRGGICITTDDDALKSVFADVSGNRDLAGATGAVYLWVDANGVFGYTSAPSLCTNAYHLKSK